MAEPSKETIYIDVDDEITTIIEKLHGSKHKIVALVLPKRAAVLQSIVNMKLLKRAATQSKKNIVLITSEAGLLPLAGAVKLHVAKTLSSKPAIPSAPDKSNTSVDLDDSEGSESEDEEPEIDTSKSIGALAGVPEDDEPIEVDQELSDDEKGDGKTKKASKGVKNKKLKVPNFDKFRTRLILAGVVFVLLGIGWYVAFFVMPKASVTIKSDNQTVTVDFPFTASTVAKTLDKEKAIVPAILKQTTKTDTEKVQATGKKDIGQKASGTVRFTTTTNCVTLVSDVAAGVTITSGGFNFVSTAGGSFSISGISGGKCVFTTGIVTVVAAASGDSYNLNARNYAVSGLPNVTAQGSDMSGGTSKIVTVVSQDDVNSAKNKLADKSKDVSKKELSDGFKKDNLFILTETFAFTDPAVTTSPNVGDESSDVSVTSVITYSMLGIKREDLNSLVVANANKQIDTSKQNISSDGLDSAVFRLNDKGDGKVQKLNVQSEAETGSHIDQEALKKQIAGKKSGDIQTMIQAYPGVKEVNARFSPFWVSRAPKNTKRITITVEQAKTNAKSD